MLYPEHLILTEEKRAYAAGYRGENILNPSGSNEARAYALGQTDAHRAWKSLQKLKQTNPILADHIEERENIKKTKY